MVLIPAGEFLMGSEERGDEEKPVHEVYVDAFYMDRHAVTNAQYARFLSQRGPGDGNLEKWIALDGNCYVRPSTRGYEAYGGRDEHPVVKVSWYGAVAHCEWAGKRLPTEAEWEKAARGGLTGKVYPWGDEDPKGRAWYADGGTKGTKPVGSHVANGYGLYDMAGNVFQWCSDWYDAGYYAKSPPKNPTGPEAGSFRVLRGGSWGSYAGSLRCAYRNIIFDPTYRFRIFGFRCVRSL